MITIIITIIVSMLLGVTSPIISFGVNLPSKNLFSQISSTNSLSDINPLKSLGKVTAPLDSLLLLGGLGRYADIKPWLPKSALEGISWFEGTLDNIDNLSVAGVLMVARSGFILVANILVTVLEIALSILRGILGLIR